MKILKIDKVDNSLDFVISTFTDKIVGYLRFDVSGYYYFEPEGEGWWSEYSLREVVNLVESKNKEYDKEVKNYFEKDGRKN